MKLINVKEKVKLSEKIQVEMSLEELAVIHALVGKANNDYIREAIAESPSLHSHYASDIDEDVSYPIYDVSLEILQQKGICLGGI